MRKNNGAPGFTLLESLLAISIMGGIAAIAFSQLHIGEMLAETRNAQRRVHLNDLLGAIQAYSVDQDGTLPPHVSLPPVSGSTTFSGAKIIGSNFDEPKGVAAGDMDGDGDPDVVGLSEDDGVRWWARSGSAPNFVWTQHVVDGSFDGEEDVALGDLDLDGRLDIVATAEDDDDVAWWRNQGGMPPTFGARVLIQGNLDEARVLALADMDNDGDPDVVVGSDPNAKKIRWYRNNGSPLVPNWEYRDPEDGFGHVHWVFVSDLDLDGDKDILAASKDQKDVTWWENRLMNGGTPWANNWNRFDIDSNFGNSAEGVFAAPIDGDSDIDVVGIGNGGVSWWENDGTPDNGNWVERVIATNFGGDALTGGDLDGDGDMDIVAASSGGDKIAWWENRGLQGFSPTAIIESGGEVNDVESIALADLDADTDLDVLAAIENTDAVAWWENRRISGVSQPAPVANIAADYKPICLWNVPLTTCDAVGGSHLDVLVPQYIDPLPVDPVGSGALLTGYEIRLEEGTPSLSLRAPLAERGATIELRGSVGTENCLVWDVVGDERTCVLFE